MWTGIHHIALVTRDLNATVAFYGEILGMEIGEILQRGVKHCFIKPGGDTWGMHFFEHPDAAIFTAPDLLTDRFIFLDGALQHIAFSLPDEQSAQMLRERLEAHKISMTPINTLGKIRNFLFFDNNGILLEAAWTGTNSQHSTS